MRKNLKNLIILVILIILTFIYLFANHFSSSSISYYFCTSEDFSNHHRMFLIQKNAHGRLLTRDPYYDSFAAGRTLVGSYDEKSQMITTYKEEYKTGGTTYFLWRFNFSSSKLYHDIVSEESFETFQQSTGLLPTPENIKKYNVKPELFKYVPNKKTDPSTVFMTFTKWSFNCQSMSYLQYKVRRFFYILNHMLASMG